MALIDGLKASILERNDETTSRQVVMPENNALCTPSIVASLVSKQSKILFDALTTTQSKVKPANVRKCIFMLWVE